MKPGRPPSFRILLFSILSLFFLFLVLGIFALHSNDIYYVRTSHLRVREHPSRTAPSPHLLKRGDHVFSLGKEMQQGDLTWMPVFLLYQPPYSHLEEGMEGWIACRGASKTYAEREPNPIKRLIVLRNLYKWKARASLNQGVKHSRLLTRLRRAVPYAGDKLVHVLLVFLIGTTLFFVLASGFRLSIGLAFLASVVTINFLGLINELIDLTTGRGSFEMMDLAANATGSAGILLPALLLFLWRGKGSASPRSSR